MLTGIVRESIEKPITKQLRREGYLIANLYGKNTPNINCAFKRNEFMKFVRAKSGLKFQVSLGSATYTCVIQEYQKDPVTGDLTHVDLRALDGSDEATFFVPVKTAGTPIGLKNKGLLIYSKRRLKVKCAPEKLPDHFTLDVSRLDVGDTVLVRDIPEIAGVEIRHDGRQAVVGVVKAK